MAQHHQAATISDDMLRRFVETIAVGGRCADVFGGPDSARAIFDVRRMCEELFAMPQSDCDAMLREVGARTKEVAPLFDIALPEAPTYDQILAGAQEALAKMEPPADAGEHSAAPATETSAQQPAAERAACAETEFQAHLADELTIAIAQSGEVSLLLLEIDHLEAMQRQYGREVAQTVLESADAIVSAVARPQDHWAPLPGGQLALLMSGAKRKGAAEAAEAIRRAFCVKPVACGNGLQIPITASVGVATYQPGMPLREPVHLMKAADLALFAAKQSGRNCVRVSTLPKTSTNVAA
jgi:two-component system, cell cycle response regulator